MLNKKSNRMRNFKNNLPIIKGISSFFNILNESQRQNLRIISDPLDY